MTDCRVCTAPTDAFMCKPCGSELERAIGDMTSLMHEVSVVATKQTRVYRANSRRRIEEDAVAQWDVEQGNIPAWLRSREGRVTLPTTALMVNLNARELLWVAGNTLSTWARHLAESRGCELPEPTITPAVVEDRRHVTIRRNRWRITTERVTVQPERRTEVDLVAWLLTNVQSARFDEAAAEIHDEITALHRELVRAVDRSPSRLFAGPCQTELADGSRCQRDLYGWPGTEEIVCDGFARPDPLDVGCRATHTVEERREWLLDSIEGALLPLAPLRAALPRLYPELTLPAPGTWRSWESRGRLIPFTEDKNGVPLFHGGDVLALVRDEGLRRGPRRKIA